MTRKDIQQVNDSIIILNGDLMFGDSDEQHIADTINAFPGYWKENPSDGVGIFSYLKSVGSEQQLAKSIKLQLISDGYTVTNPLINFDSNGKLIIEPNASR